MQHCRTDFEPGVEPPVWDFVARMAGGSTWRLHPRLRGWEVDISKWDVGIPSPAAGPRMMYSEQGLGPGDAGEAFSISAVLWPTGVPPEFQPSQDVPLDNANAAVLDALVAAGAEWLRHRPASSSTAAAAAEHAASPAALP